MQLRRWWVGWGLGGCFWGGASHPRRRCCRVGGASASKGKVAFHRQGVFSCAAAAGTGNCKLSKDSNYVIKSNYRRRPQTQLCTCEHVCVCVCARRRQRLVTCVDVVTAAVSNADVRSFFFLFHQRAQVMTCWFFFLSFYCTLQTVDHVTAKAVE